MAVFTYDPTYTYSEQISFKTTVHAFESGKEQRTSKFTPKRIFTVTFQQISSTDKTNILAFFDARKGSDEAFYWTNPLDNVQYEVRFVEDSLQVDWTEYGIYNISCQFIEVI